MSGMNFHGPKDVRAIEVRLYKINGKELGVPIFRENIGHNVRRRTRTCAFAQSDQNLHWAHFWIAKDETFLHSDNEDIILRGCAGGVESSLGTLVGRYAF